jgi:hypothetical protein
MAHLPAVGVGPHTPGKGTGGSLPGWAIPRLCSPALWTLVISIKFWRH